jgi:hypothetical protein
MHLAPQAGDDLVQALDARLDEPKVNHSDSWSLARESLAWWPMERGQRNVS